MSALTHLLHLAIPYRSNNYKAKLLQPLGLFTLLLACTVLQFGLATFTNSQPSVLGYAANISTDQVIQITNQKRQDAGLAPLNFNNMLATAALQKGQHMLEYDYWAHVAPDGTDPWYFFSNVGYKYRYAGENLAKDFSSPQAAVDAWMASPSHRDNMLSPKYTEIGIAVVEGDMSGVDTTIIVQLFGTPMTTAPSVAQNDTASSTQNIPLQQPAVASDTEETTISQEVIKENNIEMEEPATETVENPLTAVQSAPMASPLSISRLAASITIGILVILLVIDVIVLRQKRLPRNGGRILAHISFIGMIVAILVIAKAGEIL